MDLKELEQGVNPKTHWYYQSKKKPMLRFISEVFERNRKPVTLIDLGSGSGFFMYEAVEELGEMIGQVYLVDTGYSNEEIEQSRNTKFQKQHMLPTTIENAIVVMMDVLEHLPDDRAMLDDIKRRSKGQNHFFITVPAFKSLWSGHDVYLGHYRRYTTQMLRSVLSQAGFGVAKTYYLYGLIFPLVWIVRRLTNKTYKPKTSLKPVNPAVNALLKTINQQEVKISRSNRLFGVTCIAEGQI